MVLSVLLSVQIPEEILQWGYEARTRFLENLKRGSSPMYRARCLIVGCAGAGKTTVLHNLRRNSRVARTDTEGTIGMEVYEDVFDIGEIGEHSTLLGKSCQCILCVGIILLNIIILFIVELGRDNEFRRKAPSFIQYHLPFQGNAVSLVDWCELEYAISAVVISYSVLALRY